MNAFKAQAPLSVYTASYERQFAISVDAATCLQVSSPFFPLCGHTWRLTVEPVSDQGQYWLGCFIECAGMPPKGKVTCQFWVRATFPSKSTSQTTRAVKFGVANNKQSCSFPIEWNNLTNSPRGLVKDQQITLGVHMQVQHQRTDNITSDLLQQLTVFGQHYNNSLLSDVILEADHQQIHAHRVVLASQSASFKAMFESGMRDANSPVVKIGQISAPVLAAMIQFMYGRLVEIPDSTLLPLLIAADAHQVDGLR